MDNSQNKNIYEEDHFSRIRVSNSLCEGNQVFH